MPVEVTSLLLIGIVVVLLMGPKRALTLGRSAWREFRRGLAGRESSIQRQKREPVEAPGTEKDS